MPSRGYNMIYNEFYRDQDLVPNHKTNLNVADIAWEKDYFTTARPWPQKGDAITIPLGGEALVHGIAIDGNNTGFGPNTEMRESDGQAKNSPPDWTNNVYAEENPDN